MLGAVSAADDNATLSENQNMLSSNVEFEDMSTSDNLSQNAEMESVDYENQTDDNILSANEDDQVVGAGSANIKTSIVSLSPSTLIQGDYFYVKVTDENKAPIVGKTVKFVINGNTYNKVTNKKGIAYLKMNAAKKEYSISYTFSEKGYATATGKSKFLLISNPKASIKGSNYVAYRGFDNKFSVVLSVDGFKLSNRTVKFKFGNRIFERTTDANGKAELVINSKIGTYNVAYSFAGEDNINSVSGKAVVTVKKMPVNIVRYNSLVYYHKELKPFKVYVYDARGNPVPGQVIFTVSGNQFTREIDKNGIATLNLKLKAGTYKITYTFAKTSLYDKCSKSKTVTVYPISNCKNNGFWCFGSDMKKVDLDKLAKYNTKHIFLNYMALNYHGKNAVENFISEANSKGIKVHIWMQVFYNGEWVSPVYSDGSYKTSFFNSKINEAKQYASLKGVAGVHMDYLRFPGTAYNHKNGVDAINYFTKKVCDAVHGVNSKLIVSAAVMPEPESNEYYYGQDIGTLSKYLDVIIPMIYKGNYLSGSNWIKTTTATFVKQSNGAQIWTGIQSYNSDDDVTSLSTSELLKDALAASNGGAQGVIIFRWGITNFIDFNKL